MKKQLLLSICFLTAMQFGFSQNSRFVNKPGKIPYFATAQRNSQNNVPSTQSIFWSDDFADPATWTISNQTGNTDDWVIGLAIPSGSFFIPPIASTTAANGFALFDSDLLCSNDQIADLTTANSIDCSTKSSVILTFEQQYRRFDDSTFVFISNDGVNWVNFPVNVNLTNNLFCATNPDLVTINISSVAANQATVWVRFEFWSPSSYVGPGGSQGCGYSWMVDDVALNEPPSVDGEAAFVNAAGGEYTIIPVNQVNNLTFSGDIRNQGGTTLTGTTALFEIINTATSAVVFTENVNVPSLAPSTVVTLSPVGTFNTSVIGDYQCRVTYNPTGDGNAANNIASSTIFSISDSVYARDDDSDNGSLGIGAGAGQNSIIGQNFQINNPTDVSSISFWLTDVMDPNPSGTPVYVTIHPQTAGSEPDGATVLATSDSVIITPGSIAAGGQMFTVSLIGGAISLTPGLYYVGVHEVDSTLTLGRSLGIISPNIVWVSWATIPTPPAVNGWSNAEGFNLSVVYRLRMNLSTYTSVGENSSKQGVEIYPNPSTGIVNLRNIDLASGQCALKVFNSLGQDVYSTNLVNFNNSTIDLSRQPAGLYFIQVKSGDSILSKSIMISK